MATDSGIATHKDPSGHSSHALGNRKRREEPIDANSSNSKEWILDYDAFDAH